MNNQHNHRDAGEDGTEGLQAEAHGTISSKLRKFYDSVQEEGIPDRFMDLLERLDAAEQNAGKQFDRKDTAR
ncbi:hypothetical protein GOZ90_18045 [Agrobacterium vitis]|uniref:Anti-sigma factor NepR domain-containing protein n=1 Tax=Agrobacterium vitis TaxID=373 RepID=A0A1S2DN55_AGRVI|nr:NepR family anti-sigma factor [Agrobacterium vitis]MCE6077836.1 hypothetical protein [Agrobacterium vitis]MCM2453219.1 hypothetical protein [Agrobacterium vitis]MCM2471381.1 hypothetical protein [Agrobacterium vitis]MUO72436.1 hypothetical protein [Agrobacterium vitis]MUO86421.1 hypothetical protein [Agrobacterium vitis]